MAFPAHFHAQICLARHFDCAMKITLRKSEQKMYLWPKINSSNFLHVVHICFIPLLLLYLIPAFWIHIWWSILQRGGALMAWSILWENVLVPFNFWICQDDRMASTLHYNMRCCLRRQALPSVRSSNSPLVCCPFYFISLFSWGL